MANFFKSRKVVLFLITMVVCGFLLFFGKEVNPLITLYAVYAAGNVGTHFTNNIEKGK